MDGVLRAAQEGNELAMRMLYRDVQPRILRYLRVLVGDAAEDVAGEAWLRVVRDLDGFRGDLGGFRGWVATVARREAWGHLRLAGPPPGPGGPAGPDATDAAVALIATLPRDQAEAIMLRAVVGLDTKAAGRVMGKRAGAVRRAAYRGLTTLREAP